MNRCQLCNQVMVIVDSEQSKACVNPKCEHYAGKDLSNPKYSVKKNKLSEKKAK